MRSPALAKSSAASGNSLAAHRQPENQMGDKRIDRSHRTAAQFVGCGIFVVEGFVEHALRLRMASDALALQFAHPVACDAPLFPERARPLSRRLPRVAHC